MDEAKRRLRARMRAAREALPPVARATATRMVGRHLDELLADRDGGLVLAYAAHGSELDLDGWATGWSSRGGRVALPRVTAAGLEAVEVVAFDGLLPGAFGIREPTGRAVALSKVDAVLVPGLAFDVQGRRLGQGGGFYDRLLALPGRPPAIGVAFAVQLLERVPQEPHDQRVDAVVTEGGVYLGPPPQPA